MLVTLCLCTRKAPSMAFCQHWGKLSSSSGTSSHDSAHYQNFSPDKEETIHAFRCVCNMYLNPWRLFVLRRRSVWWNVYHPHPVACNALTRLEVHTHYRCRINCRHSPAVILSTHLCGFHGKVDVLSQNAAHWFFLCARTCHAGSKNTYRLFSSSLPIWK